MLGIDSDRLFPVAGQQVIAQHLPGNIDGDVPVVIESPFGHDAFLIEDALVGAATAAAARTLDMTRRVVALAVLAAARRRARDAERRARPPHPARRPTACAISVYQPRPDVPKNRMAIQVHNDGDVPLTVTSAALHSSFFTDDMVWGPDRTATVAPGYAVDLRVDLPTEADCSGVEPQLTATFGWTIGDATGTATVEPDDPFHLLDLLHDAACLIVNVDEVATLTAVSLDVPAQLPAPAELVISVEPTGADGTVTLDTIHSTTLLNPAGPRRHRRPGARPRHRDRQGRAGRGPHPDRAEPLRPARARRGQDRHPDAALRHGARRLDRPVRAGRERRAAHADVRVLLGASAGY